MRNCEFCDKVIPKNSGVEIRRHLSDGFCEIVMDFCSLRHLVTTIKEDRGGLFTEKDYEADENTGD